MYDQKFPEFHRRTSTYPPPYRFDLNLEPGENEAVDIRGHEIIDVQGASSDPNQFKAQDLENNNLAHFIHPVVNQFNFSNLTTKIELVEITNSKIQQSGPQICEKALQVFFPANEGRPMSLPNDWRIEFKHRKSGASVGKIDKYYIEPTSGRRLRSKNEVLHFLETGSKLRRRPSPNAYVRNSDTLTWGWGHKKKRSGSTAKDPRKRS